MVEAKANGEFDIALPKDGGMFEVKATLKNLQLMALVVNANRQSHSKVYMNPITHLATVRAKYLIEKKEMSITSALRQAKRQVYKHFGSLDYDLIPPTSYVQFRDKSDDSTKFTLSDQAGSWLYGFSLFAQDLGGTSDDVTKLVALLSEDLAADGLFSGLNADEKQLIFAGSELSGTTPRDLYGQVLLRELHAQRTKPPLGETWLKEKAQKTEYSDTPLFKIACSQENENQEVEYINSPKFEVCQSLHRLKRIQWMQLDSASIAYDLVKNEKSQLSKVCAQVNFATSGQHKVCFKYREVDDTEQTLCRYYTLATEPPTLVFESPEWINARSQETFRLGTALEGEYIEAINTEFDGSAALPTIKFRVFDPAGITPTKDLKVSYSYRFSPRFGEALTRAMGPMPEGIEANGIYSLPLSYETLLPEAFKKMDEVTALDKNTLAHSVAHDRHQITFLVEDLAGNRSEVNYVFGLQMYSPEVRVTCPVGPVHDVRAFRSNAERENFAHRSVADMIGNPTPWSPFSMEISWNAGKYNQPAGTSAELLKFELPPISQHWFLRRTVVRAEGIDAATHDRMLDQPTRRVETPYEINAYGEQAYHDNIHLNERTVDHSRAMKHDRILSDREGRASQALSRSSQTFYLNGKVPYAVDFQPEVFLFDEGRGKPELTSEESSWIDIMPGVHAATYLRPIPGHFLYGGCGGLCLGTIMREEWIGHITLAKPKFEVNFVELAKGVAPPVFIKHQKFCGYSYDIQFQDWWTYSPSYMYELENEMYVTQMP